MYFSRLELELDEVMATEAATLADEAIAAARDEGVTLSRDDLPALAGLFDKLARQHAGAEIDNDEVQRLARRYGSLLGEIVRARAGGAWGIGRLFDEEVRGGLLVGTIKFWPWIEARDRIAARATMPLVECIDRLCERAAAEDDEDDDDEPERRAARFESIREWIDGGCFVLYWGNDLWIDGKGHVTSS